MAGESEECVITQKWKLKKYDNMEKCQEHVRPYVYIYTYTHMRTHDIHIYAYRKGIKIFTGMLNSQFGTVVPQETKGEMQLRRERLGASPVFNIWQVSEKKKAKC